MGKFPDSADALVEDYEVDGDLVASDDEASDDDQGRAVAGPSKRRTLQAISDEEDDFALDDQEDYEESDGTREESEQEEDEYGLPVNRAVKAETERNASQALGTPATASKEDKKRKRREKTKEAKRKKTKAMDEAEAQVDTSFIAYQPPPLQADYLAEMQSIAMPSLSSMELDDFRITESYLRDTTSIEDRKSLKAFILAVTRFKAANLKQKAADKPGSPRILIVSGAGQRTADVVREVKDLAGKGEVAKLFAKHFKLAEHITFCQKTTFVIGAGTPDRIQKLIEADALHLDDLDYLFVDMLKDSKKRSILDIPESRTSLFKLLASQRLNNRLKDGKLDIVLY